MLNPPVTLFSSVESWSSSSTALCAAITLSLFVALRVRKHRWKDHSFLSKRRCRVFENWSWNNGVVIVWKSSLSLATPTLSTGSGRHFSSCEGFFQLLIFFKHGCLWTTNTAILAHYDQEYIRTLWRESTPLCLSSMSCIHALCGVIAEPISRSLRYQLNR